VSDLHFVCGVVIETMCYPFHKLNLADNNTNQTYWHYLLLRAGRSGGCWLREMLRIPVMQARNDDDDDDDAFLTKKTYQLATKVCLLTVNLSIF